MKTTGGWTPGKVAELLGISPVTLRTWNARYGIGPATHDDGRHRRYSDLDVRRLQHMQRLIERGMRAGDAAAAAMSGDTPPDIPATRRIDELAEAIDHIRLDTLPALLDETLDSLGILRAWTDVLLPVLQGLGERWLDGEECFAAEWMLATELSTALDRFSRRHGTAMPGGRPVLLACCPAERHSLPLESLRAALIEIGVPVVYLGQAVPAETVADLAAKLDPALVLLWSISPATADDLLARRLAKQDLAVGIAGPGWAARTEGAFPWVNDLSAAVDLATSLAKV